MSDVLIKMKIPEACCACPCGRHMECAVAERRPTFDEWYEEKPSWCPLIPVPPHGRLIDADAKVQTQLYDDEHEEWVDVELTVDEYLGYCHNEVPTIIPAEEET